MSLQVPIGTIRFTSIVGAFVEFLRAGAARRGYRSQPAERFRRLLGCELTIAPNHGGYDDDRAVDLNARIRELRKERAQLRTAVAQLGALNTGSGHRLGVADGNRWAMRKAEAVGAG